MSLGADVVAAGAVIARRGGREVLLVHRPKYDDWSFPKGKQDPGEHVLGTATREVWEETGLRVQLGRPLPPQFYDVSGQRSKVVNYWVGRLAPESADATFVPNSEVDELRWFSAGSAAQRLSYLDDVELLDAYRSQPKRTSALVIVRHASARKRSTWGKPDPERPLARDGRAQAEALRQVLGAYGVIKIHTSPSARCADTVEPYAQAAQLDIIMERGLSEEQSDSDRIRGLLDELLAARASAVICSHRPVLPEIFDHLGIPEEPLAAAEFVVCHHRKGSIVAVERHLTI